MSGQLREDLPVADIEHAAEIEASGLCLVVLQGLIHGRRIKDLNSTMVGQLERATTGALSGVEADGTGVEIRHAVCRAENCSHASYLVEYTSAPDQDAVLIAPYPDLRALNACRAVKSYLDQ